MNELRCPDPALASCSRPDRGRLDRGRGFALAAIVPLILVGFAAWGVTYNRLSPILRLEERAATLESGGPNSGPALARGVRLLAGGSPEDDDYTCRVRFVRGGWIAERNLRFERLAPDVWILEDAPASESVELCPDRFEDES